MHRMENGFLDQWRNLSGLRMKEGTASKSVARLSNKGFFWREL